MGQAFAANMRANYADPPPAWTLQIRKSEKKGVHAYYAKTARRQPVQLWVLEIMRRALLDRLGVTIECVTRWTDEMQDIVEGRYAARKGRVEKIDQSTLAKIDALGGTERLAAYALFHSTAEGTLHPQRDEDTCGIAFEMPLYIREGKISMPSPHPLPRRSTDITIDVFAGQAQLEAIAEECRDGEAGTDAEDEEEEEDGSEEEANYNLSSAEEEDGEQQYMDVGENPAEEEDGGDMIE